MTVIDPTAEQAGERAPWRGMVLVWGPAWKGARSSVLARELGIGEATFVSSDWRRGLIRDPLKYPRQLARTIWLLARQRPDVLVVQSPPTLLSWLAVAYGLVMRRPVLVDAHSDAFQRARWTRPRWLNVLVARRALAILVTDQAWADRLRTWGAVPLVVPDIPSTYPAKHGLRLGTGFHIAVVNSGGRDEPLEATIEAASAVPEATFHVTGRTLGREGAVADSPSNVRFTGYLPRDEYFGLLAAADAVMCLTTRDHTMQRGACEALSLARPIITSDWPLLRSYFNRGTVHVGGHAAGIADGVRAVMRDTERLGREIGELRTVRRREWAARRASILEMIDRSLPPPRRPRAG